MSTTRTDRPARKVYGRLHFGTPPMVTVEVDNRRTIPI